MRYGVGAAFETPRTRRLRQDLREMRELEAQSSVLDFEAEGDAPEKYVLTFRGKALHREGSGVAAWDGPHVVELTLGGAYPRANPKFTWKTPIAHPNIPGGGNPCFGAFTMTPMTRLTEMVELVWDMARMAVFNPYGGTGEELWYEIRKRLDFPVDKRPLRDLAPRVEREDPPAKEDEGEILYIGGVKDWRPRKPIRWDTPEDLKAIVEQYLRRRHLHHGATVYTPGEWEERGERYGEHSVLTITTEGPLGELLNYADGEGAQEELADWEAFMKSLGLWWELGYAWSVHLYPVGEA
jgi:ubiquitin-protein ligase